MDSSFFLDEPGARFLPADEMTWTVGIDNEDPCGLDRDWRHEQFALHDDSVSTALARQYLDDYEANGRASASVNLLLRSEQLRNGPKVRPFEYEDVCRAAELRAKKFLFRFGAMPPSQAVQEAKEWVEAQGAKMPPNSPAGAVARLKDPVWWRRKLLAERLQHWEKTALRLGMVCRQRALFVSDEALRIRREQRARNRNLLRALQATNELDETYSLLELAASSTSNPRNRRAELMARIAGFEDVARQNGDAGVFLTVTCPGRMHAVLSRTGKANPKYDGTSPSEAQKYLCAVWSRIRSKLKRLGVAPYGFRIVEPQHDGTPHWHLLLFVDAPHLGALIDCVKHYALATDGEEPGAHKHRVDVEEIDYAKGTAAGYAAKYVSKNIDGYGINESEDAIPASRKAERAEAWASIWRIRQFQQIGGPSVSVYRELRRLSEPIKLDHTIEAARAAADSGNWAGYITTQGGISRTTRTQEISVAHAWTDEPGRYGEPKGFKVIGIKKGCIHVQTRIHAWTIELTPDAHPLITGKPRVLRESGGASGGRSPPGGAPIPAHAAGAPVSRDARPQIPLEFCQ